MFGQWDTILVKGCDDVRSVDNGYRAVKKFVDDLARGGRPRSGLRVKGVQGAPGIFELTWAPDGRATFQFGKSIREGQPHIIWRRVGGHEILNAP